MLRGEITILTRIIDIAIKDVEPAVLREWIQNIESEIIRQRGVKDGRGAGSWVFDGNSDQEYVDKIQQGVKDGDPEIIDGLPEPRVGGEFADEPTWENILTDEGIPVDSSLDPTGRQELFDVYTAAFRDGVEHEVLAYGTHSRAS
jgi:hypothetical protein